MMLKKAFRLLRIFVLAVCFLGFLLIETMKLLLELEFEFTKFLGKKYPKIANQNGGKH
jgi:hypothetical protein